MKSILGVDVGVVTFTPGGAGVGTIAFSSVPGFKPERLLAVTNVTRKILLYVAEGGADGQSGTWSSLTSSGGTLTLDITTTGYLAGDVLRCVYMPVSDVTLFGELTARSGRNILQADLVDWSRWTGVVSYTAGYGESPISGRRSDLVVFQSNAAGLYLSSFIKGRTDGVGFTFSVWIRGSVTNVSIELRAQDGAGANEAMVSATHPVTATWKRIYISGICPIHNATTAYLNIYTGGAATFEMDGAMLEIGDSPGEYVPVAYRHPTGSFFQALVPSVARTSIYMIGDSFVGGANSVEHRTELSRLTNNSLIINAGVGGETSTQVLARWNTAYAKSGWTVIECGRNDGSAISTVLANIASMVALMPHGRFIIATVMNSSTETLGGATCAYIESLNAQLIERYGDHVANYRALLIAGRADHTPRPEYLSDTLHPSASGHGVIARCIADSMIRLGAPFGPPQVQPNSLLTVTDRSSTITTGGTAQVLAAPRYRKYLIVQNTSGGDLWIDFTATAVAASPSLKLSPGDSYVAEAGYCSSEGVSIIGATTGQAFTCKEA